jgi:hypothetical protein
MSIFPKVPIIKLLYLHSNFPNMNPTIKNVLAAIIGVIVGSAVNMSIINISGSLIAPPAEADLTTMEGLKASIHLFEPKHFLFPFLAHAIGTLVGAILAVLIAATHKKLFAFIIGGIFFIGGAVNIVVLPSPIWFSMLDLVVCYFPMGYLAWYWVGRGSK